MFNRIFYTILLSGLIIFLNWTLYQVGISREEHDIVIICLFAMTFYYRFKSHQKIKSLEKDAKLNRWWIFNKTT